MKKDEAPAMRLIRLEEDMAKYKPEKPELSKDNIKSFVQDFIDGKLKVSNEKVVFLNVLGL
jgi:protein disulfide-isomerase A1